MSTLNILNGDATWHTFQHTGLPGEVLVWREVFSEGPLSTRIDTPAFWAARAAWIARNFGEPAENYRQKVSTDLLKLENHYTDIILWFEFDVHCVVNLLGTLALIRSKGQLSNTHLWLICPDSFPGIDDFRGIGQLEASQLLDLYETRRLLNTTDLETAHYLWQTLTSDAPHNLYDRLLAKPLPPALKVIEPALIAFSTKNTRSQQGLNIIEHNLLDIYQQGQHTHQGIYQAFWKTGKIWGMGDAEIKVHLKNLAGRGLIEEPL